MKLKLSFETLEAQGFTQSFIEKLASDVETLEKVSAQGNAFRTLKFMLPHMGMALGAAALTGGFGYYAAKKKYEKHSENLKNSFNTLLTSDKQFASNPSQFLQRFSELSLISPTVAANPGLAQKVITPRLDKGFDLDDVHRLSSIEYHSAATPKLIEPGPAAQAHAAATLGRAAEIMYPILITQRMVGPIGKEVHTVANKMKANGAPHVPATATLSTEQIKGKGGQIPGLREALSKKGSVMKKEANEEAKLLVSDECMGKMLADRYCMLKTAGIIPSGANKFITDTWTKGSKQVGDYIKLMAIPLAIGGGIKLVQDLMKKRNDAQIDAQADRVFAHMRRTNSYVQENPDLAVNAFDTLRSFAPALAAKPLIAKTFVEHVITSDGRIPPDTAQMLANTQQLVNRLNEATGGGFIEGLKSPMGLFKHTVSLPEKKSATRKKTKTDNKG